MRKVQRTVEGGVRPNQSTDKVDDAFAELTETRAQVDIYDCQRNKYRTAVVVRST